MQFERQTSRENLRYSGKIGIAVQAQETILKVIEVRFKLVY